MRRIVSISVLLQAVTILMTLSLAAVCGLYALDAMHKQQDARRVPQILQISNDLYASLQNLRTERGNVFTQIESPGPMTAEAKAQIGALRARSRKALTAALAELSSVTFDSRDAAIAKLRAASDGVEALRREVDAAVQQPLAQRPANLTTRWVEAYSKLADGIEALSNRLENELTRSDPYIAEMVRIKQIAWTIRTDTGRDRFRLGSVIASGKPFDMEKRLDLAALAGRIDGAWKIVEDRVALPGMPAELHDAVANANKLYFGDVRKAHGEIISDLAAGRPISLEMRKWMLLATPGQDAISAVGKIALDCASMHAREKSADAQRDFYAAISLMALFCALGALTSWYVLRHIVRPVTKITQAMGSIADGDLNHEIPYEDRRDEIGSLARGLRVFRDNVIEKQRLRVEKDGAVAASRAKSEFLANVSHELRTPLNAIIGFSEVIKSEMFGALSERYRTYSTDIYNSGTHLLGLINEILDLSKLEAGQLELHEEVVDMAATVEACMNLIREPARKAGVHLSVFLDYDVPFILADERRLRQILINLLSNAVKFTPECGAVRLATIRVVDGLAIEVRDTGIGIAAENIPKVLTPFGQVDSKISRKHEGTGLGLPLVKHLAELHGGSLSIVSALNVGTTVTVLLPATRIVRVVKSYRSQAAG